MELIASPAILFLDEPTTGLDAATALSVMRILHELVLAHLFLYSVLLLISVCQTVHGVVSCSQLGEGLFKLSGHIYIKKNYIPME